MTGSDGASAVTVVLGRCDEMRAEVFLRADASADVPRCTIAGTLAGPRRGRDTTLPVTVRFQPTATGGVARALLTEPAYWTPDLPNLYRFAATVRSGDAPPRLIDRLVGLRRLGVRGRSLWLDGRRWVPRAVRAEGCAGIDACKPAALAALVTDPDESTLAHADAIGVAVLALVSATTADPAAIADRIAAWSAHPSAALAILSQEFSAANIAAIARAALPRRDTLLLAAEVTGIHPPPATTFPGIDALVVSLEVDQLPHDTWRDGAEVPLVAWRRAGAAPGAGRAPCDALQAALATWAAAGKPDARARDWAGYVVG